ncbi:hypothetical protein EDB87DRAFT_1616078 [Lactarius vividus]|nr:hypothetical protein EDB87DRAFT_1616078 [Lactarius vividus]
MMIFRVPAVFLFLAVGASAAPVVVPQQVAVVQQGKREVWSPPVLNPHKGTIWHIGSTVTVAWNTSTRPPQVTNPTGTLLLGYLQPDGEGGENLDVDHPLAQGFPLDAGKVRFIVPRVKPRKNYIVALIGDSGNISPKFTIEK